MMPLARLEVVLKNMRGTFWTAGLGGIHSPYLLNWHIFVLVKFKANSGKIERLESA